MPTDLPVRARPGIEDWTTSSTICAALILAATVFCGSLLPVKLWLPALSLELLTVALIISFLAGPSALLTRAGSSIAFLWAAAAVFSDDAAVIALMSDLGPSDRK